MRGSSDTGMPRPRSMTRTRMRRRWLARGPTRGGRRRACSAFSSRFGERALELRGVGLDQRQVGVDRELDAMARRRRDVLDGGAQDLLDRASRSAARRRRPAAGRGRAACRPAARAAALGADHRGQLRRWSAASSVGESSASAAARIAVSGERRSCETARSSAVLISSRAAQRLRLDDLLLLELVAGMRRASMSAAERGGAAAGCAGARSVSGIRRSERTDHGRRLRPGPTCALDRHGGVAVGVPHRCQPRASVVQTEFVGQSGRRPDRSASPRLGTSPSRICASSAARSASRPAATRFRRSGPAPDSASALASDRRDEEDAPAQPSWLGLVDRELAGRRDVEEVERALRWRPTSPARATAAQYIETSSTTTM